MAEEIEDDGFVTVHVSPYHTVQGTRAEVEAMLGALACPSCREPLVTPSGDGCAAMTGQRRVALDELARLGQEWDAAPAPDADAIREAALREAINVCKVMQTKAKTNAAWLHACEIEEAIAALLTEKPHDRA